MKIETFFKYLALFGAQILGTQFTALVAQLTGFGIPQNAALVLAALIIGVPAIIGALGLHLQSSPADAKMLGK